MNRESLGGEQHNVPRVLSSAQRGRSEVAGDRESLEDAALVGLVNEGDGPALEVLYGRYGRACYSLARRIVNDEVIAQDVVQDVYLALWRDAGRFDPQRGGFATWLLSMTHHKAVDAVRREENLRKRRDAADAVAATAAPAEGPDDAAWATLRRERVRDALSVLPAAQKEALGLAYYGGYTQREIAGLTGTPLGTVKTRMLAGMRKMRAVLEGALDEGEPA